MQPPGWRVSDAGSARRGAISGFAIPGFAGGVGLREKETQMSLLIHRNRMQTATVVTIVVCAITAVSTGPPQGA